MNISVVGAGYVGLVTGAVFADLGNEVVCVDNVADKISALQSGHLPIYEPGLEEMVARNVGDSRLSFSTDLAAAVRKSDIVFIAVGTPPKVDGQTDLSAVEAVARDIGRSMDRYTVVVNKSTVPVGTGEFVREVIERHQQQPVPFDVVSNPEFLREGSAIEDTLRPDRIVIGAPSQQVAMTLLELYAPLERTMIITYVPSAETIKYASNAFLATKIEVIKRLIDLGATVCAYDPVAMANARKMLPTVVEYAESPYTAAASADGVALITEWNEFKFLNLERLRSVMRRPVVFDGRNLWVTERMRRLGFEYYSIGRKPVRRT